MKQLLGLLAAVVLLAGCQSPVSQANYDRIEQGMAQSEVIALLGEPDDFSAFEIGGVSGASASWTGRRGTISVQFFNHRVQAKGFTGGESNKGEAS